MIHILCVLYILSGCGIDNSPKYISSDSNIDRIELDAKEYKCDTKNIKTINKTELKYFPYLNGYRKVEAEKLADVLTWLDILHTCVFLVKTNILILSYNFKAAIQHSNHVNFGFYFPNDLETFVKLTKALRKTRGF